MFDHFTSKKDTATTDNTTPTSSTQSASTSSSSSSTISPSNSKPSRRSSLLGAIQEKLDQKRDAESDEYVKKILMKPSLEKIDFNGQTPGEFINYLKQAMEHELVKLGKKANPKHQYKANFFKKLYTFAINTKLSFAEVLAAIQTTLENDEETKEFKNSFGKTSVLNPNNTLNDLKGFLANKKILQAIEQYKATSKQEQKQEAIQSASDDKNSGTPQTLSSSVIAHRRSSSVSFVLKYGETLRLQDLVSITGLTDELTKLATEKLAFEKRVEKLISLFKSIPTLTPNQKMAFVLASLTYIVPAFITTYPDSFIANDADMQGSISKSIDEASKSLKENLTEADFIKIMMALCRSLFLFSQKYQGSQNLLDKAIYDIIHTALATMNQQDAKSHPTIEFLYTRIKTDLGLDKRGRHNRFFKLLVKAASTLDTTTPVLEDIKKLAKPYIDAMNGLNALWEQFLEEKNPEQLHALAKQIESRTKICESLYDELLPFKVELGLESESINHNYKRVQDIQKVKLQSEKCLELRAFISQHTKTYPHLFGLTPEYAKQQGVTKLNNAVINAYREIKRQTDIDNLITSGKTREFFIAALDLYEALPLPPTSNQDYEQVVNLRNITKDAMSFLFQSGSCADAKKLLVGLYACLNEINKREPGFVEVSSKGDLFEITEASQNTLLEYLITLHKHVYSLCKSKNFGNMDAEIKKEQTRFCDAVEKTQKTFAKRKSVEPTRSSSASSTLEEKPHPVTQFGGPLSNTDSTENKKSTSQTISTPITKATISSTDNNEKPVTDDKSDYIFTLELQEDDLNWNGPEETAKPAPTLFRIT